MQPQTQFAISKRAYYADFFTVPVATTIAVLWLISNHNVRPDAFASAALLGFLAWTFFEYAVHRWVFHGRKTDMVAGHRFHHVHPNDFIGASPITTAIMGAIAFWVLTASFGPCIGVGLLVGFVVGYLVYITIHGMFHHANIRSGILKTLKSNHEYHHSRFRVNFGVSSPVWDIIFGTYQRAPR